jgi:hypothetical protein
MFSITISGPLAFLLAAGGAAWIYVDGQKRRMETADLWAVGFFIGMFIPPIIGAVVVGMLYLQKRNGRRGEPSAVGYQP